MREGGGVAEQRWAEAPVGLLTMTPDGAVLDVNDTLVLWLGRGREFFDEDRTIHDLLSLGGRLYWETHLSLLLRLERHLEEIATELNTADGPLPVLLNAAWSPTSPETVHVGLAKVSDRTMYEEELRAAQRESARSARQASVLQRCMAALSSQVTTGEVETAVLAAATGALEAAAARLWLISRDGALTEAGRVGDGAEGIPAPAGDLNALPTGTVQAHGQVVIPLRNHAAVVAVLVLALPTDPGIEPLTSDVFTAFGQQAGLALDRARLYEQSTLVAQELQQALLRTGPFEDPRFAVATAYRPGEAGLEVGGDWHDAFLVDDTTLVFSVGDVVGRGLHAAAAMGQLRSAVRAVADPHLRPGPLLGRLDQFVALVPDAALATVAYAELDLATGDLRYACAGHPPPLLLPGQGAPPVLLWEGRSTPLGSFFRPDDRHEGNLRLRPGDRVVLYTDGLIEDRDHSLDAGFARLAAAARDVQDRDGSDVASHLIGLPLGPRTDQDDRCLLVVTWQGTQFNKQIDASLGALSGTRQELRAWLLRHGADEVAAADLVLATSEAIANAAEHGSRWQRDAMVTIRAHWQRVPQGVEELVVAVHDHGRWSTGPRSIGRGRGLLIMAALVDAVSVYEDHGTTVTLRRALNGGRQ